MLMKNIPEIQMFSNRFHAMKIKNKVTGSLITPKSSA